jgi:hypothetical protein
MKVKFLCLAFVVLNGASAYCGGVLETKLVNEQAVEVDYVNDIEISYRSEEITLLKSYTNSLIIKEYMSRDDDNYYAVVTNFGNKLTVKGGKRPVMLFNARIEVYIPAPLVPGVTIKTISGKIVAPDDYTCSRIALQTTSGGISVNTLVADTIGITSASGSIRCEKINGNIIVKTTSGGIHLGIIEGDISAKTSSGEIKFDIATGSIMTETTSGKTYCSINDIVGDISLISKSGDIELAIPQNSLFNFSARTSSGHLSTPFPEELFNPVSDRNLTQGIIGEGSPDDTIHIETISGSIKVR